jgi:tRNA-dihydrouridine synthase A
LRHATVHRLKRDFSRLTFVINGGISRSEDIEAQLDHVDGVMVGRAAYHDPFAMTSWDALFFGAAQRAMDRDDVERRMLRYMEGVVAAGEPWTHVSRHMLGLRNGLPGARRWRRVWSDHRLHGQAPGDVWRLAGEALTAPACLDAV